MLSLKLRGPTDAKNRKEMTVQDTISVSLVHLYWRRLFNTCTYLRHVSASGGVSPSSLPQRFNYYSVFYDQGKYHAPTFIESSDP